MKKSYASGFFFDDMNNLGFEVNIGKIVVEQDVMIWGPDSKTYSRKGSKNIAGLSVAMYPYGDLFETLNEARRNVIVKILKYL